MADLKTFVKSSRDGSQARGRRYEEISKMTGDIGLHDSPAERAGRIVSQTFYSGGHVVALEPVPQVVEEEFVRMGLAAHTSKASDLVLRLIDICGALVVLLCASPVMLFVGVLVKLTSRGPIFSRQQRVGKGRKTFTLYKFRTMVNDPEKHVGSVWAARDDGRVTPIGRVLRRTFLDELPQLYNVLRGDLSLVGPIPERPYFVARRKALQGVRLDVKPGITGLAQVTSLFGCKPVPRVNLDYMYIQNRSPLLNIRILLQTAVVFCLSVGKRLR